MCGCWVFVIEERNLKGQLPQLKLDNCLLHGFHQVSEKMHEENQNEILIHKLCQEPLQNHGLDSCQEKEPMDKPTLLKDLARLHPNKNPTRIPEDSPPKWSQLIPLLMGHCFFLPILSAGPLPALDSQVLVRHLRPQLIYVVAPPSKHPWREPYEYMQSVCTVYICIYIIISYLILIASICFIFLKIFKDIL